MRSRMACAWKSGVVSMRMTRPLYPIITDGRVRRSCGWIDVQTRQSQPSVGTPIEVPLPSTVSVACMLLCEPAGGRRSLSDGIGELQIGHAGLEQNIVQHVLLGLGEIAFGLLT